MGQLRVGYWHHIASGVLNFESISAPFCKETSKMRRKTILLALVSVMLIGAAASAQGQLFDNGKVDYTLELPSSTWRLITSPDSINQNVEFVYGDRSDGLLRIRKETVDTGVTPSDLLKQDQDQRLRFQPGYVDGRQDNFAGRLNGVTFSYEYVAGGKPMSGRIYYLQADGRTIYTLRFTGARDKLSRLRNQTDIIARSFKLK
jgi:hypothetical protein